MRKKSLAAIYGMTAVIALAGSKAHADLIIAASIDNGATFATIADSPNPAGPAVGPITFNIGSFSIVVISADSNSPGTASLANTESSTLHIVNTDANTTATDNLIIAVSATGFTAPVTPPSDVLASHIGGTVTIGNSLNTASFTSCLIEGTSNSNSCSGAAATAGPGLPDITFGGLGGSFSNDQTAIVNSLTAPYTMAEVLNLTLAGLSEVGFQANTQLTPVPEPTSLTLLGTGLLGLGLLWRRRRAG